MLGEKIQAIIVILLVSPAAAAEKDRMLFDFAGEEVAKNWRTVNDGVMGGLSDGRFKINDQQQMVFYGNLSLQNNGGFASIRTRGANLGLERGDQIVVRVRGDGRKYNLDLYVPRNVGRYSFRKSFRTKKDEWIEVSLPVEKFMASYRGRVFPQVKLDPSQADGLGFILADKRQGTFELEVDWVRVSSPQTATQAASVRPISPSGSKAALGAR